MAETSNIAEIDHALRTIWDKAPLISTSISYQGGRPVSFAPIINPPAAETMIERMARILANELGKFGADVSAQELSVEEHGAIARAVITAMREPTDAMLAAGYGNTKGDPDHTGCSDNPIPDDSWPAMIDAALAEQG